MVIDHKFDIWSIIYLRFDQFQKHIFDNNYESYEKAESVPVTIILGRFDPGLTDAEIIVVGRAGGGEWRSSAPSPAAPPPTPRHKGVGGTAPPRPVSGMMIASWLRWAHVLRIPVNLSVIQAAETGNQLVKQSIN